MIQSNICIVQLFSLPVTSFNDAKDNPASPQTKKHLQIFANVDLATR